MQAFSINDHEMVIAEDMAEACRVAAGRDVQKLELMPMSVIMPAEALCGEVDKIINTVSQSLGVKRSVMLSGSRAVAVVSARHIACYILHTYYDKTLKECAEAVGRSDHTIALNSVKRVEISFKYKNALYFKLMVVLDVLGLKED